MVIRMVLKTSLLNTPERMGSILRKDLIKSIPLIARLLTEIDVLFFDKPRICDM